MILGAVSPNMKQERSQVEGSDRWWRGAVSNGGERSLSQVEGSCLNGKAQRSSCVCTRAQHN